MAKAAVIDALEVPKGFIDVLYLANQPRMPSKLKRLLKHKKLSFSALSIEKFTQLRDRLYLVGTVVIDTESLDTSQQQKLARIIESLQVQSVGTILLGQKLQSSPKSSFLTGPPVDSLAVAVPVQVVSIDELWLRISANLASRKKNPAVIVEPPVILTNLQSAGPQQLADELCMTETLIGNLAEQLRMAGLVQRDFLPAKLPNSERLQWGATFMPAEWVSGDIYDVTRVDEQHIGFYVADVVGHGIPAAILTIFLKQALVMRQTLKSSYVIFPPAEVMKNLNIRMTGQKLSGYQFATCCYCLLNTKTLRLTYSRAGHPYPILIRAGCQPKQLQIQGPLLGIFKQAEYIQQSVQLQPGDKLVLYSDGAEPFIGAFDEQEGFDFCEQFLKIKDLPIVKMVDEFNALTQNKIIDPTEVDDVTMLGLEIV